MSLDPTAQMINDLVVAARADGDGSMDPELMREGYRLLLGGVQPAELQCFRSDVDIDGRSAILLTPSDPTDRILVWFHGGGWVLGSPDLSLAECDALASQANCRVLSFDYRRAPESRFPAAFDDAIHCVRWVMSHAESLGIDRQHVAVGGDSAGGNLAAAVALELGTTLSAQLLVYPKVDVSRRSDAAFTYEDGYLLNWKTMEWFGEQYCSTEQTSDVRMSPMLADDEQLASVAPAHIVIAEFDPLRDDGFEYAARLERLGVPVSTDYYANQMHLFFSFPSLIPDAALAVANAASFLRERA